MSIMFGTVFYGLYIVWDRKVDVLKEILVAPVSRVTVFFGKVLGGATDAMIQSTILLVLGMFLVGISAPGVLAATGVGILLAIGMVSIGLTLGAFFESFEGFQVVVTFLIFPLFFLSGALFPIDGLDPAFAVAVQLDPVTYAVDAMRGILVGVQHFPMWLDISVLVGFDIVMVAVGTWAFRRMKL
jgi:ABC-2 type transport system permease protein